MRPSSAKKKLIISLSTLFLSLTYIIVGYVSCISSPLPTQLIANFAISQQPSSIYTHDGLVKAAEAFRVYSFVNGDAEKLYATLNQIKDDETSLAGANYAFANTELTRENADALGEKSTVTTKQLDHLTDVYDLSSNLIFPCLGIASISAFLLMIALRMFGMGAIQTILKWSGICTVALFAFVGICAAISFGTFFSLFHEVLFAQGNWTFSADSLLISALPTKFWMLMLGFWITCSVGIALISIALSFFLKHKTNLKQSA